jgi:MurNAc alpha-1-phosphate uridylyltransferase
MKAMILAAGRGQRLRPITDHTPKPLLKVGNKRLIEYHLESLKNAGFADVVINVAHLPDQIMQTLGSGERYGLNIQYSVEPEGGLETGGGIFNALAMLGNDFFLVINGDIWTDYPLQQLPRKTKGLAHLVLIDNPAHNPSGDFALDGHYVRPKGEKCLTLMGLYICHPKLFAKCQPGSFRIPPLFTKAMEQNLITGEHYTGKWIDVGSVERLRELETLISSNSNLNSPK